jgi:hypothetical protein
MKVKRRSPVTGPLLTFGLMVASVVAVGAIAHMVDSRQKAEQSQTTAVASDGSQQPVNRQ